MTKSSTPMVRAGYVIFNAFVKSTSATPGGNFPANDLLVMGRILGTLGELMSLQHQSVFVSDNGVG